MIRILLLSLLGITFYTSACCHPAKHETRKRLPDFYVVSTERNKELSKEEALFSFTISNGDFSGYIKNGLEVHASCNEERFDYNLNEGLVHTLKVKPGKYIFQFYIDGYEEIYSDSVTIEPGYQSDVRLFFREAKYEIMEEKPVIYLYPKSDLNVQVTVEPRGEMTFTYPEMGKGWNGTAHPDGSITVNNKTFPYLFWEAKQSAATTAVDLKKGFIVKGSEAVAFLEKQLSKMGMNEREQTDFITYWGPRLTVNEQQFVHFLVNASCDQVADLNISPKPDAVYRIFMIWSPLPENATVITEPQELPAMDRSGYHVVEWGGSEINLNLFSLSQHRL